MRITKKHKETKERWNGKRRPGTGERSVHCFGKFRQVWRGKTCMAVSSERIAFGICTFSVVLLKYRFERSNLHKLSPCLVFCLKLKCYICLFFFPLDKSFSNIDRCQGRVDKWTLIIAFCIIAAEKVWTR